VIIAPITLVLLLAVVFRRCDVLVVGSPSGIGGCTTVGGRGNGFLDGGGGGRLLTGGEPTLGKLDGAAELEVIRLKSSIDMQPSGDCCPPLQNSSTAVLTSSMVE
jgi:hypothetical protein